MNPLSMRNNNPGNMRPIGKQGGFQAFSTPEQGMDAMRRDLMVKVLGKSNAMKANYGDNYQPSLKNLISTWAPPTENDTNNYINFVSQKTGIQPQQVLSPADVEKIIPAMIEQEGGKKAAEYFNQPQTQDAPLTPEEQAELARYEADAPLTPDEQAELAKYEQEFSQQQNTQLTPAQEFQNDHPFIRTLGRGGRAVASGLSSVADLALLAPKTAALGAGLVAENMGATEMGRGLQRFGQIPTMADTTKTIIDQATGDRLKPTGFWDKAGDFVSETIASVAPFTKGAAALETMKQPPNVGDAVSSVLNPQKTAENIFINKYPAPEKITAEIVRKNAGEAYKTAAEKGGILKPETVDNFLDTLQKTVKPQDKVAQALSKDDPANAVMDILEEMTRGKEMNLDTLQAVDEVLSNKIDNFIEFGRPKKEGFGLIKIQDALRNMVENAGEGDIIGSKEGFEALNEARKLWSKAARLRDVERIVTRAEMAQQPANAMKAGFSALYNNPNRMRGFSKAEQAAIKKAAESGIIDEILKGPASRLTSIGAGLIGGVPGYAIGKTAEMAARGTGAALQAKRADALAQMILGTTPKVSGPLLTQQGSGTAIGLANALGQKLLPSPQPQISPYLMNMSKALQGAQ